MDEADKQRLVGAAVLVTLAVIVLPVFFGNPQDPTATISSSFEGAAVKLDAPRSQVAAPVIPEVADLPPPLPEPAARQPDRESVPPAPARRSGWVLQLASFSQKANADRLEQRLRESGHRSWSEAVTVRGKRLHRVRVGPLPSESGARALQRELEAEFKVKIRLYPPAPASRSGG